MIVKIQTPIDGGDGPALIYNKDRSFTAHTHIDSHIEKLMGKKPKKFFHAKKKPDGSLDIGKEAPWQEW